MINKKFIFVTACIKNGKLWFVTDRTYMLCEMDLETYIVYCHTVLPEPLKPVQHLVGAIVVCGNRIIMAPHSGEEFLLYDTETKLLERKPCEIKSACKFNHAIEDKNKIYFISGWTPGFAEYDIKKETFTMHNEFADAGENKIDEGNTWSRGDGYIEKGALYIPLANKNYILRVDLQEYHFSFLDMGNQGKGYNAIINCNKAYWAIPRNGGSIKKGNIDTHKWENLNFAEQYIFSGSDRIAWNQENIFILDSNKLELYKLNMCSEQFNKCQFRVNNKEMLPEYIGHRILWMGEWEDKLFFLKSDGSFLIWDETNQKIEEGNFLLAEGDVSWYRCLGMHLKGKMVMEQSVPLQEMLQSLPQINMDGNLKEPYGLVGKKIHETVKEECI